MNCSDVQRHVYTYLDREFDDRDRLEFECHLAACSPCRADVAKNATFRSAVRRHLCSGPVDGDVRQRLQARLLDCDQRAGGPTVRVAIAMAAAVAFAVIGWQLYGADSLSVVTGPMLAAGQFGGTTAATGLAAAPMRVKLPPRNVAGVVADESDMPSMALGAAAALPELEASRPTRLRRQDSHRLVQVAVSGEAIGAAPEVLSGAVDASFLTERGPFGAVRSQTNLRSIVRAHAAPLPLEVRGHADEVRRWLRERLPGVQGPPISEGAGVVLLGARLSQLAGRPVVLYAYVAFDRSMTVVQHLHNTAGQPPFDDPDVEERQPGEPGQTGAIVDHLAGYQVLHTLREGELLSVVSELDSQALRGVVETPTFL